MKSSARFRRLFGLAVREGVFMQTQKFLKVLVIGLGVAIVLALGLVVYGVARLSKAPQAPVATAPVQPAITAETPVDLMDLKQPIGTEIEQILQHGNGRVAALLKGGMVPDRIVIIDLASGRIESTIYVTAPDKASSP